MRSKCDLPADRAGVHVVGHVGELFGRFISWLHYDLPARTTVISVRTGHYLGRQWWARLAAERAGALERDVRVGFVPHPLLFHSSYLVPSWRLAIEDPFKLSLVGATSLRGQLVIEAEVVRAAEMLKAAAAAAMTAALTAKYTVEQLWSPITAAEVVQRDSRCRSRALTFLYLCDDPSGSRPADSVNARHLAVDEDLKRRTNKHISTERVACVAGVPPPRGSSQEKQLAALRAVMATPTASPA